MANISSYNQLSSWNEDDDLLFVQQPDAPKKAHPSQMKEYILGGLDVSSVGGTGKYISAISEADGKINATAETMDEAPTEGSENIVSSGGVAVALSDLQTQINTLNGDNKTIIPENADINNIQYTAVGQYITNGSNKNIQNVPNAVKNLSFYMKVINSLTNESVQISSAWKERIQIIIPIDASAMYIREAKSNASASDITYGSWQTVLTDKSASLTGSFNIDTTQHPNAENSVIVRQFGKVVSINGYILRANLPNSGTTYRLGTLSNVSNPPIDIRTLGTIANAAYDNGDNVYLVVGTDGSISIKTRSSVGSSLAIYFSVTYIAN